jgi:hypothetical protein
VVRYLDQRKLAGEALRLRDQIADLTDESMGFPTTDSVNRWFDAEFPILAAVISEFGADQ